MIEPLSEFLSTKKIILASGSPRRKEILENIGLRFDVIPSSFEENLNPSDFDSTWGYVIETAYQKALEVRERLKLKMNEIPELIISADTVVCLDGKMFGKPNNENSAREMLSLFSGKFHEVYTGVVLLWNGLTSEDTSDKSSMSTSFYVDKFYEKTIVKMATLSEGIISSYIKSGEPLDKAGSYGIQGIGGSIIESINGDYYNVVGFPLHKFCLFVQNHYSESKRT